MANTRENVAKEELTDDQRHALQLWVEALESGEYNQIKGSYFHINGACAMGVKILTYLKHFYGAYDWETARRALAIAAVKDWHNWCPVEDISEGYIPHLNDAGMPFTEIAQWLRKEYL